MLEFLVIGYFLLIFYWIYRMFSNLRRRLQSRCKVVPIFKSVDKRDDPVFKATYNPKEFRCPRK